MSEIVSTKMPLDILSMDATEIAKSIRQKKITSYEVTKILINHIQTINPALNAVVEDRFSEAMIEAREMDANIDHPSNRNKPLYGLPISVKEAIHVKGMKTTGAIEHRKDLIMSKDADVVEKLKEAGAIILCKTNTPSLSFYHETDNKLYGRTNNAWDIERTSGGSSGGEAALIGVGGTPVGISSDIGGSIRFPSHFNGVVGFKPGMNQVSSAGHFPPDLIPIKTRMSAIGPIGKSVRDVQLVYDLIKQSSKKRSLYEKMNVEMLPIDSGYPLSKSSISLIEKVQEFIKDKYNTIFSVPPYFNDSALLWQEIMSIDGGKEIRQLAFNTDRPNVWRQYMRERLTGNTQTHLYLSWALIGANMFKPSQKRTREINALLEEGDRILNSYLLNKLLIFPVYHRAANKHGELYKEIFSVNKSYLKFMPYIAYANVWGLPSLTVPIGFDSNDMPIGMQIISKVGNEGAIFQLGQLIEKEFGGYMRSSLYD